MTTTRKLAELGLALARYAPTIDGFRPPYEIEISIRGAIGLDVRSGEAPAGSSLDLPPGPTLVRDVMDLRMIVLREAMSWDFDSITGARDDAIEALHDLERMLVRMRVIKRITE